MEYQPLEVQPFDPANHAAAAAERRKRLMGAPSRLPSRSPEVVFIETLRLRQFDEHVKTWRKWLRFLPIGRISGFVYRRCTEIGIDYMDVIGPARFDCLVAYRHQLMWEARERLEPPPSFPEIGRTFGGRDHTSAMHGYRAHEKRMASK